MNDLVEGLRSLMKGAGENCERIYYHLTDEQRIQLAEWCKELIEWREAWLRCERDDW